MTKKLSVLLLMSCLVVLLIGCKNDKPNEASSYEKGIDALHVEELQDAKKHFKSAVKDEDKDQEQAEEYLTYIETAEDMQDALSEEDYDQALEKYKAVKDDDKFSSIQFMLSKDQDELEEVMAERGEIDGQLGLLTDLTDTDQADSFVNDQLKKLSDNKYLSAKQNKAIKNLQNSENNGNSKEEQPQKTEDENGHEEENESNGKKNNSDNEDTEENHHNDENQNENNENGNGENENNEEEAESLVYDYVKENEVVDIDLLEDGTVTLNMDHETEDGNYVFQLYETVDQGNSGHTATYGWYEINIETEEIEEMI